MKNNGVKFYGMPSSSSGYGLATYELADGFYNSSIPTAFCNISAKDKIFKENNVDFKNHNIDFFMHVPPFSKHRTSKYRIGYFYWETDTLPDVWASDIKRSLDEVWVPCELVKNAVIKSGFNKPVYLVHTPYLSNLKTEKVNLPGLAPNSTLSDDIYKFYSIFQWGERKGYYTLLNAYLREFTSDDPVVLILKVNPVQTKGHGIEKIKRDILKARQRVNKKSQPKILLITSTLKTEQINGLHAMADCFVLPHHGEGWGMPIHTAMVFGKKIITTKYGGVTEYLNNDSAMIIEHNLSPVFKMDWNPWYDPKQKWAYPKEEHLMLLMRNAFSEKREHCCLGLKAKEIGLELSSESLSKRIDQILNTPRNRK